MEKTNRNKLFTLISREMQEYRNSLLVTPLVVGGALVLLMLASVLFANRIALLGDGLMGVLAGDEARGYKLEIQFDNEGDAHIIEERPGEAPEDEPDAAQASPQELVISPVPDPPEEEAWNFSHEWTFTPPHRETRRAGGSHVHEIDSLNPVFMGLNNLFMFIMFLVSVNYLLGCLYADRKDKSILFWKSMPVSEWQEVLCKLAVALLIVPIVYLAASLATQMLTMALAMLLVWRMEGAPMQMVFSNIQFGSLVFNQVGGSIVWVFWILPAYAWFMLSSAAAKRSPFLLAIAIPVGLVLVEEFLVGSRFVLTAIGNHMPHLTDGDDTGSLGLYVYGPAWAELDYFGMLLGLGFAALALYGAVWLRRFRFET